MKAAIIDVDGTLLTGPRSSEALFIRHLLRQGVLGPRQAAAAGWFMLHHGPRYGRHAFRKNKSYLAGLRLADIAVVAEHFADDHLKPIISNLLLRRIEEHRAAGAQILLLTGTPAFLAGPLARIVGADGYKAARYDVRGGIFRAAPPIEHPLGGDKVAMAMSLCKRAGTTLAEAAAYADSIHDLPLLSKAGHPVAVQPDPRLRREALARGWEVMEKADDNNSRMARNRATHA